MWIEPGRLDLTYCTNIHPGESWPEVRANVERYALELKSQLSPETSFGIGLRLSAEAAAGLLRGAELQDFKAFLDRNGLYVALINGFPFGSFHCGIVKSEVFAPDWREAARVRYTLDLIRVLAHLLPPALDGGISTIPLSYKPWLRRHGADFSVWPSIVANLALVVEELVRVRRETGKLIHIDIEPEPDGLVENTEELIRFFEGPLAESGGALLGGLLSVSEREARQHLFTHIRACFDTCHLSVEYEDLTDSLHRLQNHGIGIGRIQVSSAIRASFDQAEEAREQVLAQLQPFAESVYLHQVIEQHTDRSLRRYHDLGEALAGVLHPTAGEWRIHYHVPLFTDVYGALSSTHEANRKILAAMVASPATTHLEIETYTWDVLPAALKIGLVPSIAREYGWVLNEVRSQPRPPQVATPRNLNPSAGSMHA